MALLQECPRCKEKLSFWYQVEAWEEEGVKRLPRGLHTDRVFPRYGQPFREIKHGFQAAREKTKIENFTFHDPRDCALNYLRETGNDFFKIMAMSGHKTISVFKRYNLVTEEELAQVKWPSQQENGNNLEKSGMTSQ